MSSSKSNRCGFAALCMIASFADINLNPDELVSKAKKENMSNHGEMFSSYNMSVFAKDLFRSNFEVTLFKTSIKGQSYQIRKYLKDNCLILIPYPFNYTCKNMEVTFKLDTFGYFVCLI